MQSGRIFTQCCSLVVKVIACHTKDLGLITHMGSVCEAHF